MTVCPKGKGVQAPCGARVRAAIGLAPWAAQVPPTERAGSKGSYKCCLSAAPPLVAGATTFAPLGSVSLDSQSPKGSLRIQFPCHAHFVVGLWMLGSGVNLSLWQQRRENHTTGLRPEENKQTSLRSRKCTPFGASAPPFPRRGNFALRSAFGPISILRHNAAKTSPSGGGAVGRRGAFPRAAGAVLRFSLPMAALPPTGGNNTHRREAAIPPPSAAEGGCRPLSEANTTLLHNLRRSRTPSPSESFEPSEPLEPSNQITTNATSPLAYQPTNYYRRTP